LNSIKSKDSIDGFDSMNNTSQQFNLQDTTGANTTQGSPRKKKLMSMSEYITNFTKQNNIDLKYEKFPIQLFLD
jgi:hypothetical protein